MDNLNIPKLPYNGDVNEAQRQGDRAAIRTIMAWRKRRELGESEPEESVKDAEPSLTKASDQSTSLDANSTPSHLEPIRGQSSSAAQSTPTTADAARTSINSPGATPEVSLAQAPTIDTYNGNNSDSDDGPPPLEACSDTSSDEGDPRSISTLCVRVLLFIVFYGHIVSIFAAAFRFSVFLSSPHVRVHVSAQSCTVHVFSTW